ncbi:MAG: spermidine synthase [Acidobacteriia bacterium]|nr:spermidine synthase [Terriglobia bacterium]
MLSAVSLAFFVSGAAGLIFEVVWFHRAGLVFGNSVWAASLVLSSFMAGLALGNGSIAWIGARLRRPLRAYAALETVVAMTGIAITTLLPALSTLLVPLTRLAGDPGNTVWLVNLIRFVAAFAVLVVPAAAMGATLPVLTGALTRADARFGYVLGRLYGWNTLGAVAGVVFAEVVLVDRLGVTGTAWTAGLLNLSAAAAALWLSTRANERSVEDAPTPATVATGRRPVRLLASACLAGAALLALEVIWFRFLSMYVLTTTLAVSVMLAAVLAAIGLGGLAASWWLVRQPRASAHAAAIALAGGCSVIVAYAAFQALTGGVQIGEWRRVLWFACALTFPPSFLSGVLFTLLGDAVQREMGVATRAAAWLTLANTTGAMCGPLIAAFVLLPTLGMERAFFALAIVYGAIGALASPLTFGRSARLPPSQKASADRRSPGGGGPAERVSLCATAIALAAALVFFPFGLAAKYFARVVEPYAADGSEIVATREGPAESILLMQQTWMGQPVYSRLVTNGFSMSGTALSAQRYMRDFVYWPLLLHQAPLRRILVICYGVGVTAGAAVDVASAQSIDVVELSRDIVAMSDVIYPPDGRTRGSAPTNPLHDPRVRLHVEDGRNFLQTTTARFDLITGEPPPPRTPGAVNIYTREYFQLVHDRLADGGMTTYWLPVARPQPGADVDTIARAFCDVFNDCSLWNATPFDFMLVGTRRAARQTADAFAAPWSVPRLAARLREAGFERPEQIGATFLGDAGYLRALTAPAPPLTDDFPHRIVPVVTRPSLSDPRYRDDPRIVDLFQRVLDPVRAQRAFAASPFIARLWPADVIEKTLPYFETQRIINRVLWDGGRPLQQIEDLHLVLTQTTLETLPLWLLGSDDVKQRIAESSSDRTGPTEYARGVRALSMRDYRRAAAYFSEAERRGMPGPTVRPLLIYSLCLAGDLDSARQLARGAPARDADEQHFWNWMSRTFGVFS